jgi:hypothetical protein
VSADIRQEPNDVIVIDGLRFSRQFFTMFANEPINMIVRIIKREDGIVTVERVTPANDLDWK